MKEIYLVFWEIIFTNPPMQLRGNEVKQCSDLSTTHVNHHHWQDLISPWK